MSIRLFIKTYKINQDFRRVRDGIISIHDSLFKFNTEIDPFPILIQVDNIMHTLVASFSLETTEGVTEP